MSANHLFHAVERFTSFLHFAFPVSFSFGGPRVEEQRTLPIVDS